MTENQQRAHDLFFHTDLNQQQIADILTVNRKTLYCWIKEGKWIRAKYAANHAPIILAEQYYAQLGALNRKIAEREDPFPTKEEADIQRKITMTLNNVRNDKRTPSEVIELFSNFTSSLKNKDHELARQVITHMDDYIKEIQQTGQFVNSNRELREEKEFEKEYEQWLNSHFPPSPPATGTPTAPAPITPNPGTPTSGSPITPTAAPSHSRITPSAHVAAPPCYCPAPHHHETYTEPDRVQNRVRPKSPSLPKALPVKGLRRKAAIKLSTNKNKKQGVISSRHRKCTIAHGF